MVDGEQQTLFPNMKPELISRGGAEPSAPPKPAGAKGAAPAGWPPWEQPGYVKRIRASALAHGKICPASVFLGQAREAAGVDNSTAFTAMGTKGHRWLELRLSKGAQAAAEYLAEVQAPDALRLSLAELWRWLCETAPSPAFQDPQPGGLQVVTECRMPPFLVGDGVTITGTRDLAEVMGSRAWVTDWKFYNDPSMLPPVSEDLQIYAYAVGTWRQFPQVERVTVHRVLCYHLRIDVLDLDSETLALAELALAEEAQGIWDGRESFRYGAQCGQCLERRGCQRFLQAQRDIGARKMKPYQGGDFDRDSEVLRFLLAVPSLQALIDEGMAAAKRYVETRREGRPILDLTSGKDWGPRSRSVDAIVDHKGCVAELMDRVGRDAAIGTVKVTKSAMEAALKAAEAKPAERREFFATLRDLGYLKKSESDPQWRWAKAKP